MASYIPAETGLKNLEPATERELASMLRSANEAGLAVIPRGGGTKLDWGNPPLRSDMFLSTARLNRVLEHAWSDMTVTVEAGCTIDHLQETLGRHGQRLAVDPLWPQRATIGGILATNDSGALRLRYGGLRDLIIGVSLALADGTLAQSGGKVVKNVAGYDLPKLATGSLGTLGVITRAVFRLHPLPGNMRTFSIRVRNASEMQRLAFAAEDSRLAHAALQVRLADEHPPEVDILLEGTEAGIASQEARLRRLAGTSEVLEGAPDVWSARESLWSSADCPAISKISVLPAEIVTAIEAMQNASKRLGAKWSAVVQGTGLGCLRLDGTPEALSSMLAELRREFERRAGSLVILRRPHGMPALDAWGDAGDAVVLSRALKYQFDPRGILNPGRFVGGI